MLKATIYYMCAMALAALAASGCTRDLHIDDSVDTLPDIYPDYIGVTIPPNIAPLNFHVRGGGDYGVIIDGHTLRARDGAVDIPPDLWSALLRRHAGDSLTVTVCRRSGHGWTACRPFGIHVSADSIDPVLVYRLIPPLYGTWREMGIYQRDLTTYSERPIYENVAYHGNCVNCHSFCGRDAGRMLLHLRGPGGATYLMADGRRRRLDTKTDSTISNFTYPYWHPSGRYVAFSVNDIFQVFHTADPNRAEVIDDASDVVIYDVERNIVYSAPVLKAPGTLETFPAFSADGSRLFFCSAVRPDTLPDMYRQVHYSLCAVDFDASTGRVGAEVDTLIRADGVRSVSFPRPSPDGRWLVATVSSYGNFSIWHQDADLWMHDLARGVTWPMEAANSTAAESYHSWSGNSRWLVYSSRRDDGYYTRPYIVHVSADGTIGRPFMLPQRDPEHYYTHQRNSFNIPEFADGPVPLDTRAIVDWIAQPPQQVTPSP